MLERISRRQTVMPFTRHREQGFSLIDIMVAVSILMILAAVAVPRYTDYVMQSRRADAHHLLLANSIRLERCLTLVGSYDSDCPLRQESAEGYYTLKNKLDAQSWTLGAVPTDKGAQNTDKDCTAIILTHAGVKSATGNSADDCW